MVCQLLLRSGLKLLEQAMYQQTLTATDGSTLSKKAVTISSDFTADAIVNAVKKYKCNLIVMASQGRRGMKRLLMGSKALHVLTHSHIPVLVLR